MLEGRHVVVTGGGTGVGAAAARDLAGAGAAVTVVGRRAEALGAAAAAHEAIGTATADVTDRTSLSAAFDVARRERGPIAVMVANAGISSSAPFHRLEPEVMQQTLEVNVMGVFHSFQLALGDMREHGWGRLVAVASTTGLAGYPYVAHYCASKHAVVGMVRAVAKEVASRGITANAVCPSYVDTPMTDRTIDNIVTQTGRTRDEAVAALVELNPQGRLIAPSEVAATIRWLCSDAAASVNGHALPLDGGEL